MAAIVRRGDRRRGPRRHDLAHHRPPRRRRRAGARHLRRRGRAVRARPRPGRGRAGRLRAGPRRRPGRGPHGAGPRAGVDAPPGRRDRAPHHLRLPPARRGPRRLAAHARAGGEAHADGVPLHPQITGRPIGMLLGLQTFHPFVPAHLRGHRRAAPRGTGRGCAGPRCARDPRRGASCTDRPTSRSGLDRVFPLGEPPDYEPRARAGASPPWPARAGVDPMEMVYDMLLRRDGRELLLRRCSATAASTTRPSARCCCTRPVLGIGDGGAHVRAICDASIPTYMLTHWARDRRRGARCRSSSWCTR